jgi:uncharacterized membrane protein
MPLLAALIFGIVAGLRVFTGEAVFFGFRGGWAGIGFPILAIGEYIADAMPGMMARTQLFPSFTLRVLSGAFMGFVAGRIIGAILGVIGAVIGTLYGYRARMAAITRFGPLPAAIVEDVIAIALAFAAVALQHRAQTPYSAADALPYCIRTGVQHLTCFVR